MNNTFTYLVCLPQGTTLNAGLNTLMNSAEKREIFPGVTLVRSDRALTDWYSAIGAHTTTSPVVIPVDVEALEDVKNVPQITQFLQTSKAA